MTLGEKLQKLRREYPLTQEQLAEKLEVSRQAVSRWEADAAYPETEKLVRLARLYGCSLDYLLLEENDTPGTPPRQETEAPFYKRWYFERTSKTMVGGLPLWHVNIGIGRCARGVFALGLCARGIVSAGILSFGVLSLGAFAFGAVAVGSFAAGLLALGAIAMGLAAFGAIAVGALAVGALAVGGFAVGALAIGACGAVGDTARAAVAIGFTDAAGEAFSHIGEITPEVRDAAKTAIYEVTPRFLREVMYWFLGVV